MQQIPFSGTGPIADQILNGTLRVQDPIVQLVLDNLKRQPGVQTISPQVTLEEVKGKFQNWKETTSTSPITKRHLGHYQCLTRIVDAEEEEDPTDEVRRARKILNAHFLLVAYSVKFGISLTRWQNVVNSMIEKEPGNPKIHRLRVIHLYEADYNLILGIFWSRKLVRQAEDKRLFNSGCYGSRPGLSAVDPVLLEELQVSISYLSRTNQVTFHNDATSCYDRIIIALANLVARRFGMPAAIAKLHGATLEQMQYYVSTALGILAESYSHSYSGDSPIYGTGQGSCASPSIWLQICSILFDCHNQKSYGAHYQSPDGTIQFKTSMTGFVDDTKGQVNDLMEPHPMPLQELIAHMQADAQLRGDLLHVTGGALEIPKCNYYVMNWKFQSSGIPELDADVNTLLHLENGDRTSSVTLTNDAIVVAHKTLGTWKSAARDQTRQVAELQIKCNEYSRTIMASPLTRVDNWTAYYAIYLPRLTFVLPTSYIPASTLKRIEQRAVGATLCKGGFVSTFPRKVAFGPNKYGGNDMRPLDIEQLVQQTQTILKHLRSQGENNDMLRITLSWAQTATGMSFPLLAEPTNSVPHLECEWLQSIRAGLGGINGHIAMVQSYTLTQRRVNDKHIMDEVCASNHYTTNQVRRINACRVYLQVTLLSDITQPNGKLIIPKYYKGDLSERVNWPTMTYPRQHKPDRTSWGLWRRSLHQLYLKHDKKTLRTALGIWHPAENNHQKWKWNYAWGVLHVQQTETSPIVRCALQSSVRRKFQFARRGTIVPCVPEESIPVDVTATATHQQVAFSQMFPLPSRPEILPATNIKEMIDQLPKSLQQLVNHIETMASEEDVNRCLQLQHPIYLASDGGAIPGRASYGWILQIGDTKIARGKGPTYGDDTRSFRAEGYGMASALLYLRMIQRERRFTRDRRSINTIICDNEGLLLRIAEASEWKYTTPNVTLRAEWDIESVILDLHKQLNMRFAFKHVKSHQDDNPQATLTLETRLNIEADRLATEYMTEDETHRPTVTLFPTAKAQLIIGGVSVTRKIPQALRFAAGSGPIRQYLRERNEWTEQTLEEIDWDAHGASHSYHRPQRCYLIKLCHRHLPLGKTLHRRNNKYPATCPGCRDTLECQTHYLQCSSPSRLQWRITFLTALRTKLTALRTAPHLQEAILGCIDNTLAARDVSTAGPFQEALLSQERIGWIGMLRGYWSSKWQEAYNNTYAIPQTETRKERNKRQQDMTRWQKKVIQTMWGQLIDLWTLRNTERHGWDTESRNNARREVLHHELAEIYIQKHEYPARVQRLLRATYELHITESITKIADWLDAYKGTFAVTWSPD